jgi:hypothetical protein
VWFRVPTARRRITRTSPNPAADMHDALTGTRPVVVCNPDAGDLATALASPEPAIEATAWPTHGRRATWRWLGRRVRAGVGHKHPIG